MLQRNSIDVTTGCNESMNVRDIARTRNERHIGYMAKHPIIKGKVFNNKRQSILASFQYGLWRLPEDCKQPELRILPLSFS